MAKQTITGGMTSQAVTDALNSNFTELYGKTLNDNSVTESKIATDAVTSNKIKNGAVTEDKIASNAITTNKIKDGSVTRDKLASDVLTKTSVGLDKVSNITISSGTSIPSGGSDGDIYLQY